MTLIDEAAMKRAGERASLSQRIQQMVWEYMDSQIGMGDGTKLAEKIIKEVEAVYAK